MRTSTNPEAKVALPHGPWQDEPDKAVWVDPATDLDCMVVRNRMGALCGYVGVGPDHPWHGEDHSGVDIEIHGGLTYSDACQEEADEFGICHVPEPGRSHDIWWFGFDCAHVNDIVPKLGFVEEFPPWGVYRDIGYVKREVEALARQLTDADRVRPEGRGDPRSSS